jgi:hypothetical protein
MRGLLLVAIVSLACTPVGPEEEPEDEPGPRPIHAEQVLVGPGDKVLAWIGESTPERGGRRRRVYRLEPAGARELREWYRGIKDIAVGTGPLLDALAGESR